MSDNNIAKCPHCGGIILPAAMLGSVKKTMTDSAKSQRKQAVESRWLNHGKKIVTTSGAGLAYRADLTEERIDELFAKHPEIQIIQVPRGYFVRD